MWLEIPSSGKLSTHMNQKTNRFEYFLRKKIPFYKNSRSKKIFLVYVIGTFTIVFISILLTGKFIFIFSQRNLDQFEIGKPAPESITIDHTIQYTDEAATETRRKAVAQLVPPVFILKEHIISKSISEFSHFTAIINEGITKNQNAKKVFLQVQKELPGAMSEKDFMSLYNYPDVIQLLPFFQILLSDIMNRGYLENPFNYFNGLALNQIEIILQREDKRERLTVLLTEILQKDSIGAYIKVRITEAKLPKDTFFPLMAMFNAFGKTNLFYDEEMTNKIRNEERESVAPVIRTLAKGETIITKGKIISKHDIVKIKEIAQYSASVNIKIILGSAFFLLLVFILSFVLLRPPLIEFNLDLQQISILSVMTVFYAVLTAVLYRLTDIPNWLPFAITVPTAISVMLISILVSYRTGIISSLLLSFVTLIITDMNMHSYLFALLSGLAGAVIIKDTEKRIELVKAGVYLALANVSFTFVLGFFNRYSPEQFIQGGAWSLLHGLFTGILILGILPILEHVFNSATKFRLMELSDLNNPVLRRLLTFAPGTYTHSVSVANLSENACRNIGANFLLARVGAYYHDIGKLDQPDYYSENQQFGNRHDHLKPSLSASIIKAHVKNSAEKARELKLPKQVVDIIAQHHGTTLIRFFYEKAVSGEGLENVSPEDYYHSGPLPETKEAAVVMIADSVEAATRTLKKPTVSRLEKTVWSIMMDKFNSGQLNNCPLTFKDLDKLRKTFVRILTGYFHSRIEYPGVRGIRA